MKNYRIHYDDSNREKVLDIISNFSNDVLINNIKDQSVGITIETDDAKNLYLKLLREIDVKTHEHQEHEEEAYSNNHGRQI